MFNTDANPFGNVTMQSWGTTATADTARPTAHLLQNNTVFVLPGPVREDSRSTGQNLPVLFENQSGFGNFVNYLVGGLGRSNLPAFNKGVRSSFIDTSAWEDAFDPETGLPRVASLANRINGLSTPLRGSQNPFDQSLDLVS